MQRCGVQGAVHAVSCKVQEAGCGARVNATMLPVPILYTRINALIDDGSEMENNY